jgi:hypothetical protein
LSETEHIVSKEQLSKLIEPHILKRLDGKEYRIYTIPAKKLLGVNRFDLAIKLWYLEALHRNSADYEDAALAYKEHIRAFTCGNFKEKGNAAKTGIECYYNDFKEVLNRIERDGFDCNLSVIPLAKSGEILNGAHRVASAIFLGKSVSVVQTELKAPKFNFKYFLERNVNPHFLMRTALSFARNSDEVYLKILCSKSNSALDESLVWEGELLVTSLFWSRLKKISEHLDDILNSDNLIESSKTCYIMLCYGQIPNSTAHQTIYIKGIWIEHLLNTLFISGLCNIPEAELRLGLNSLNRRVESDEFPGKVASFSRNLKDEGIRLNMKSHLYRKVLYILHCLKYRVLKAGGIVLRFLGFRF